METERGRRLMNDLLGYPAVRPPIEPYWATGRLESVNVGTERHQPKAPAAAITLVRGHGVVGDAHAGPYRLHGAAKAVSPNTREVSLLDGRVIDMLGELGYIMSPGDLGENLTVRGIPLDDMEPGDRLYCGSLVLEVTEKRVPCANLPTVDRRMVSALVGRAGLLARVLRDGTVCAGMEVRAERAEMPARDRDELTERVLAAARAAFGGSLRGAILKGSAYKGGFLPGFSDFDVHLLVSGDAMDGPLTPRLEAAVQLQRGLGRIETQRYRVSSVQVFAVNVDSDPEEWLPPLPGTFTLLWGEYPAAWDAPDPEAVRLHARKLISGLGQVREAQIRSYQDKSDADLPRVVRFLGTLVKPALYSGAALHGYDPLSVWRTRPLEVAPWAGRRGLAWQSLWTFLTRAGDWEALCRDAEALRAMWLAGMEALADIEAWAAAAPDSSEAGQRRTRAAPEA